MRSTPTSAAALAHRIAIRTRRSALLALSAVVHIGCALGTAPSAAIDAGDAGDDPAEWRIVYLGWDDNELANPIASDVQEIVDADLPGDLFATIIVRDSVLSNGEIDFVVPGGTERRAIDVPRSPSIFDDKTLAAVREQIDSLYPARGEIVVFAGHGRGWRGVGVRSGLDSLIAAPTALAGFLPPVDDRFQRLVVVDAGYGAVAEVLLEYAPGCTSVVATTSRRDSDGIDFGAVGFALRSIPLSEIGEIEEIGEVFFDALETHAPTRTVWATGEELAALGDTIIACSAAATELITSYETQTAVQTAALDAAIVPELPGEAFIPLHSVTEILAVPSPPPRVRVLLHLVSLDELGTSIGHDTGYRRGSEDTALAPRFAALPWAPDLVRREGIIFDLWYRQF